MNKHSTSYIGLDVHKDTIAVAVAEPGRKPPRFECESGVSSSVAQMSLDRTLR